MTSILNTFFQCCETNQDNKQEILSNNESIIKSISSQDQNLYLYKKCNSNSINSNNEKSNQKKKQYSFISNISQNSEKKSQTSSKGKKDDNSLIFNINSSFRQYNKVHNNNHQFTSALNLNHMKENNSYKKRISLTEMNLEFNKKNPFFLDSRLISINNSINKNNNINNDNDIILNLKSNINIKQLFIIFYDRKKTRYYIQYLNKEFNKNKLFMSIRIFNEFFINKNENKFFYLLLGKLIVHISIGENDMLNFKVFKNFSSSNEKRKMSQYNFEIKDSPITIGRENCSITIDNNFLSRIHCTFIYGKNNKWCLIDGNEKRKHSTHGTWIILNNNIFELNPSNENYEVKIGQQSFNISIQTE